MKKTLILLSTILIVLCAALLGGCIFFSQEQKDENITVTFYLDGSEYMVEDIDNGTLTLPNAPTKNGYAFGGWYTEENGGGRLLHEGDTITKDTNAYAHWLLMHTVTVDFGGRFQSIQGHAVDGQGLALGEIVTTGYDLEGFFCDSDFTEPFSVTQPIYQDTTVYAKITPIRYTITYRGLQGAINLNPTSYDVENTFTLQAPVGYYDRFFDGWYANDSGVSTLQYMIGDITVEARWTSYQRINADGTPAAYGNYLLWGFYPQTIKDEAVALTETVDGRGYVLGSDNCYYAPIVASPDEISLANGVTFSNGIAPEAGKTYYFKVEPMKWRILSHASGTNPTVHLTSVVDVAAYKISSSGTHVNYYQNSTLKSRFFDRDFLNYFTGEQQHYVVLGEIATTGLHAGLSEPTEDDPNYASTKDYFYTFSVREASPAVGPLSSPKARQFKATDYAIAKGVLADGEGNAAWWTRSHASSEVQSIYAQIVDYTGNFQPYEIVRDHIGVLPVCVFSFERLNFS